MRWRMGEVMAMTNAEVIRLAAEVVTVVISLMAGAAWIVSRISQVLNEVKVLRRVVGHDDDDHEPHPTSVLGRLLHQDKCVDSLRDEVRADKEESLRQRTTIAERLSRIEAKLDIPAPKEKS